MEISINTAFLLLSASVGFYGFRHHKKFMISYLLLNAAILFFISAVAGLVYFFNCDVALALPLTLLFYFYYRYISFQDFLRRNGISIEYYNYIRSLHRTLRADLDRYGIHEPAQDFCVYPLNPNISFFHLLSKIRFFEKIAHSHGIPLSKPVFDFADKYFSPDRPVPRR